MSLPDCFPENILYSGSTTVTYPCDNFVVQTTPSNAEYAKSTVAKIKRHYPAFGGSYDVVGNITITNDPTNTGTVLYSIRTSYLDGETANVFETIVSLNTAQKPVSLNATFGIPSGIPIYADFQSGIPSGDLKQAIATIRWPDANATTNITFTFLDTDIRGRWNVKVDVVTVQGMALYLNSYTDTRLAEPDAESSNFLLPAGYGKCSDECGVDCPGLYISASTDVFGGKNLAQSVCWIISKTPIKGVQCDDVTTVVQSLGLCTAYQTVFSRYPFKINCYVKGTGTLARKAAEITKEYFQGAWAETIEKRIIIFALYRYFIWFFIKGEFDQTIVLNGRTKEFNDALAKSKYSCWTAIFEHRLLRGFNKFFYETVQECDCNDEGCDDNCKEINVDELNIPEDLKQQFKIAMMSSKSEVKALPAPSIKDKPTKSLRR